MQYGSLGLFCAYLIFDRQVMMKKLIAALDRLSSQVSRCPFKKKEEV